MANTSEEVEVAYIDACFTVWSRAASNIDIRNLIMLADSYTPSPVDSIYKLDSLVKKCNAMDNIRWALSAIVDVIEHHGVQANEFVLRKFTGRGEPGGKGIIDLFLAQRDLGKAIIQHAMDKNYSATLIKTLNSWLVGHDIYREDIQPGSHNAVVLATLAGSAQSLARVFEDHGMK